METPTDVALIWNIILTILFILLLLIPFLIISIKKCPHVKVVDFTKAKTQSVPLEGLIADLQKTENFTLPEKLQIQKKPSEVDIEKDRQLLIFLLQEHLQKQKREGNKNPYISINDLKEEIKYSLKNSTEILKLLDETINNMESSTSPPLNTTSPPLNTTSPPLNTTSPPLNTTSPPV